MKTVNMYEAKTRLSQLVEAVERKNEDIVICRNRKPVAKLVPFPRSHDRLSPDPSLRIKLHYDPTEPLTDDEMPKILTNAG